MLSQERDGEEKGLWPESKRNRTWIIFTTRFSYHRQHGNDSYSRLQEACLFDHKKVRETLQQVYAVDLMQVELLTAALSHHVLAWSRSSWHNQQSRYKWAIGSLCTCYKRSDNRWDVQICNYCGHSFSFVFSGFTNTPTGRLISDTSTRPYQARVSYYSYCELTSMLT